MMKTRMATASPVAMAEACVGVTYICSLLLGDVNMCLVEFRVKLKTKAQFTM